MAGLQSQMVARLPFPTMRNGPAGRPLAANTGRLKTWIFLPTLPRLGFCVELCFQLNAPSAEGLISGRERTTSADERTGRAGSLQLKVRGSESMLVENKGGYILTIPEVSPDLCALHSLKASLPSL